MQVITIELLNQRHRIKCGDDEADDLKHAANLLNDKLLEIKQNFNNLDASQIMMLAALTISCECFQAKQKSDENSHKMTHFVKAIESKIQTTLNACDDKKTFALEE